MNNIAPNLKKKTLRPGRQPLAGAKDPENGATLVEVMMAVFVYTIGLLAILMVLGQSASSGKRADYTYTAYNIAKNHIERLKAVSFASLDDAGETNTLIAQNGLPDLSGMYHRTTTVEDFLTFGTAKKVTVSVYYTLKGVDSTPVTITSVIYGGV